MRTENNDQLLKPTPRDSIEQSTNRQSEPLPGVQNWLNIAGLPKTVTATPTQAPKKMRDSIVIYIDNLTTPTVKRLYIYSRDARIWNYVTLT